MVQNGERWEPPDPSDRFDGAKDVDKAVLARSIKVPIEATSASPYQAGNDAQLIWMVGNAADQITSWGTQHPKRRDRELAAWFPSEEFLSSALGTVCARNAAFGWNIEGTPEVVSMYKDILQNSDEGRGWSSLITKTSIDLYTQDLGAYWELVRAGDGPEAVVIGVNNLESLRCYQTGDPLKPVVYVDRLGKYHLLDWWSVVHFAEMPAPREQWPGLQLCAVTRLLRASQIMRNIAIYKDEKTGGRHARAIHLVRGLTNDQIQDALSKMSDSLNSRGVMRYTNPLIIASVDPKAEIGHDTLELSTLPDGFNESETIKNFITILAMAFLTDYQEFAPLPGGNLGTSAQSEVLHMKTRGKGPSLFMKLISEAINRKITPKGIDFFFDEQDYDADKTEEEVRKLRADRYQVYVAGQMLQPESAALSLVREGDIEEEIYLEDVRLRQAAQDEERQFQEDQLAATAAATLPALPAPRVPTEVVPEGDGSGQGTGSKSLSPFWQGPDVWKNYDL